MRSSGPPWAHATCNSNCSKVGSVAARLVGLGSLLVAIATTVAAQPAAFSLSAAEAFAPAEGHVEAHVRFLASDDLFGRRAGDPGSDVAAQYIASQFRMALVAPGGHDGYFQEVNLDRDPETRRHRLGHDGDTVISSRNVVGRIDGSHPVLSDSFVVLVAHYDHVGAGLHLGRGSSEADSIFNGARDNAVGVAALINAARVLAANPPKRSILLLATTAEEMGLLGSRHFVADPTVDLTRVQFVLNTDGAGYSDTDALTLVGAGRTTADRHIAAAAAAFRLHVIRDPAPNLNLFERSDNYPFARAGIPAVTVSTGFKELTDPGVAEYYHRPTDEVDEHLDFGYLNRFVGAYALAAFLIADDPAPRKWMSRDGSGMTEADAVSD